MKLMIEKGANNMCIWERVVTKQEWCDECGKEQNEIIMVSGSTTICEECLNKEEM